MKFQDWKAFGVSLMVFQKQNKWILPWIKSLTFRLNAIVETITLTSSCRVLQSLLFIMLGHMGETHLDGKSVQVMIFFDLDITAWMFQFCI